MFNLIKSFVYGLISGLTEILPLSAGGHQLVFRKIFGESINFGICNIFVHIGMLVALVYTCGVFLKRIQRAGRGAASHNRRVIKDAILPFVLVSIVLMFFTTMDLNLLLVAVLFVVNGVILFLPSCIATGNKDGRSMSILDSILMGFAGALSVFPGLSRMGSMTTMVSLRGGDRHHALIWALALSIPASIVLIVIDIYSAVTQGISFQFSQSFYYLFSFVGAFCGTSGAVKILRKFVKAIGLSYLAYYSWGMAMLAFILYLMI